MSRLLAVLSMVAIVGSVGEVRSASAQMLASGREALRRGEILGTVTDDAKRPLAGVVVSAVGSSSAFAVTDRSGRYGFRGLAPGTYLLRAHLEGYAPAASALVQVNGGARAMLPITLLAPGARTVLSASVAPTNAAPAEEPREATSEESSSDDNHGTLAWRLRHTKRGVLKDAETAIADLHRRDSFFEDSLDSVTRVVLASARLASAVIADLSGELNLLTTTSFGQPERLFRPDAGVLHGGVAHLNLVSPGSRGDWSLRGALTQGDLSSWVLAGAYNRDSAATHAYEAGVSYSMQRYLGGNAVALAAVADGTRTAGTMFAYDNWHLGRSVTVAYGGKYARYGYLAEGGLFSPRVAMTVNATPSLQLRAKASRHATAPGAEEFQPPAAIGLWLPPERTFSSLTAGEAFATERVAHYEVALEQVLPYGWSVGGRAFRQHVDDQLITIFGLSLPRSAAADMGHYYVASAGDVRGHGWGVSVSRTIVGTVRGSVGYTATRARWSGGSPDLDSLASVAPAYLRHDRERLRDVTSTVEAEVPATATRMYVMYRVNTSAPVMTGLPSTNGARFDVQIHQRLPFLNFSNAQWAMLIAVRNVFHEEALDASAYDELLVIRPPKRVVGGVTVRF
jgi:outer membrane receptor protein involved in Fe transport